LDPGHGDVGHHFPFWMQKGKELNDFQRNLLRYRDSFKSEVRLPWDERQELDRHDLAYPSGPHNFFSKKWPLLKLIHSPVVRGTNKCRGFGGHLLVLSSNGSVDLFRDWLVSDLWNCFSGFVRMGLAGWTATLVLHPLYTQKLSTSWKTTLWGRLRRCSVWIYPRHNTYRDSTNLTIRVLWFHRGPWFPFLRYHSHDTVTQNLGISLTTLNQVCRRRVSDGGHASTESRRLGVMKTSPSVCDRGVHTALRFSVCAHVLKVRPTRCDVVFLC
jgi:hypothetical protein